MTTTTLILDEVKKDSIANKAIEMYQNEGYQIEIDDYIDTDNIAYVRTIITSPDQMSSIVNTSSSLQDIKDFFSTQLDIIRP